VNERPECAKKPDTARSISTPESQMPKVQFPTNLDTVDVVLFRKESS